MGHSDERVTLASQQTRAHNLAWALHAVESLRDDRVAVVGGGLAGLTFAVIAGRLGAKVTLYEQAGRLLSTQWKSYDRYLHPRLFHWPEEDWADGHAGHPALPWRDNFAAAVRDVVLAQVPHDIELEIRLGVLVTGVLPGVDDVTICVREVGRESDALRIDEPCFDRAILATGFPVERPEGDAFGGSYWRAHCDAALIPDGCRRVRIVGNGDGALTELMNLSLPGFRQDRLRDFATVLANLPTASDLATWSGGCHARISECLQADQKLGSTLGRAVDDLSVEVIATDHKLTTRSFLLNNCAAVAIEQAQMQRGRPPIFCPPRDKHYRVGEISKDLAAGTQVVWRVGPSGSNHLLLTFDLLAADWPGPRNVSWKRHWSNKFEQLVTTSRQSWRREGCHDVDLPDKVVEPLRTDGIPTPLLTEDTKSDREDVIPALNALATIAKRHVALDHILDTSATRLVGDEAGDDRRVLLAVDAIAAVASLPTGMVVDSLVEKGIEMNAFASGLLLVARGLAEIPESNPKFRTLATHVAIDAAKVRGHLLRNRHEIRTFLQDLDLLEAVALAIRSRRRRTDLPAAVLLRLGEVGEPREELRAATSRLLRLVAIALTPGSAGGQGRLGLLRLGRAALDNQWLAGDLARFIVTKPDRLGQRLVFSSLLRVVSPLRAETILPITRDFARKWVRTVAPYSGRTLRADFEPYRNFADAVRQLVDSDRDRNVDLRPGVEAMLRECDLEARLVENADGGSLLRRFGLTVDSTDAV